MAISPSLSSPFPALFNFHEKTNNMVTPIFFFFFLVFSLSSLSFLLISIWKTNKKKKHKEEQRGHDHENEDQHQKSRITNKGNGLSLLRYSISDKTHHGNPTLLVEILTSKAGIGFFPNQHQQSTSPPNSPPKYDTMLKRILESKQSPIATETTTTIATSTHDKEEGDVGELREGKKKKKRTKKKKQHHNSNKENQCGEEDENPLAMTSKTVTMARVEEEKMGCNCGIDRGDLHSVECLYPFTSSSSVLQRKIKQQYDQLVKSNHDKALTLAQVGQFANCLIEAKTTLQHKSEIIQRRFTITKSLLFKADKSSFDRLCAQIYKLEMEQRRLEEDALVYNRLQEQIKLSPAYKKMLEIGSHIELQASSEQLLETPDSEFSDITFEELLAQEKKDSFWQKNGKLRACTS